MIAARAAVEMVDVVDRNDVVVGSVPKRDVYTKGLTNRIVHIFVVHPENGNIFLQERSKTVGYLPGYYCTSAGGHVMSGEAYDDAARRELKEELGLDAFPQFIQKFIFDCKERSPSTRRFIALYIVYVNKGIKFVDGEVSGGRFFSEEEVDLLLKKGEKIHPQLEPCYRVYLKYKMESPSL